VLLHQQQMRGTGKFCSSSRNAARVDTRRPPTNLENRPWSMEPVYTHSMSHGNESSARAWDWRR